MFLILYPQIQLVNGGSSNLLNSCEETNNIDVEQVPREMKGKEAIRIVDMFKSFHVGLSFRKFKFQYEMMDFCSTVGNPKSRLLMVLI